MTLVNEKTTILNWPQLFQDDSPASDELAVMIINKTEEWMAQHLYTDKVGKCETCGGISLKKVGMNDLEDYERFLMKALKGWQPVKIT